jgi:hypothetical protein
MNEPLWVLLLKVFGGPLVSGLVAAGITYWFSRRRFIGERWWDRKADAYGSIIGGLVELVRWLEWQMKYEERCWREPGYKPSEEALKVIRDLPT